MYLVVIILALVAVLLYRRTAALAVRSAKDRDAVIKSLRELQAAFPTLSMKLDEHPRFDLLATFPRQPGLTFDISVEMEGDVLHLTVGQHLVLELWTHNHPERITEAIDDVRGLLAGGYRVVLYRQGETVVGAELQTPTNWEVVGAWWEFNQAAELPRQQFSTQVLQNATSP